MLNKVQYRRIASFSVSVLAVTGNVVSAAVSATAVTGKSGFGRSLVGRRTRVFLGERLL